MHVSTVSYEPIREGHDLHGRRYHETRSNRTGDVHGVQYRGWILMGVHHLAWSLDVSSGPLRAVSHLAVLSRYQHGQYGHRFSALQDHLLTKETRMNIAAKRNYVRRATQTRNHKCHWP